MGFPLSNAPRNQGFTHRAPMKKASPMVKAAAPLAPHAAMLAGQGQGSDRHLVHVNDRELMGLKAMTPTGGGPNPVTGLPQFDGAPFTGPDPVSAAPAAAAAPANPWAIFGSTQSPYDLSGGVPGQGTGQGAASTSGMKGGIAGLGTDANSNLVRAELGGGSLSTIDQLAQQDGLGTVGANGNWQGAGYTTSNGTGTNLGGGTDKSTTGNTTTSSGLSTADVQSLIQAAIAAQGGNLGQRTADVTNVPVTNPDGSVTTTQGPGQTAAQVLSQLTPNRTNRFASDYFAPNFAA